MRVFLVYNKHYQYFNLFFTVYKFYFSLIFNIIFFIFLGKTYHERKTHLKFLPFKCSIELCNCSFASKSALNYHIKYQHGKNQKKFEENNKNILNIDDLYLKMSENDN